MNLYNRAPLGLLLLLIDGEITEEQFNQRMKQ
jgi:hypothetical protein